MTIQETSAASTASAIREYLSVHPDIGLSGQALDKMATELVRVCGYQPEENSYLSHWLLAMRSRLGSCREAAAAWDENYGKSWDNYTLLADMFARQGDAVVASSVVPEFSDVALHKLKSLQDRGYAITGYAIEKPVEGGRPDRGFINHGGFVGWWREDCGAVVAPAAVAVPDGHRLGRATVKDGRVKSFSFEQSDAPDGEFHLYSAALAATPAADVPVVLPEWEKVRRGLTMVMLGLAGRPDCSESAIEAALDAVTEPGMPLAGLRMLAGRSAAAAREAAAVKTLESKGFTWRGGEEWAPPIGKAPDFDLIDSLRARIADLEATKAAPVVLPAGWVAIPLEPSAEQWRDAQGTLLDVNWDAVTCFAARLQALIAITRSQWKEAAAQPAGAVLGARVATLWVEDSGAIDFEVLPPCTLPPGEYPLHTAIAAQATKEA